MSRFRRAVTECYSPMMGMSIWSFLAYSSLLASFWIEGLVVEVSPERGTVTVSHREIEGVMPAMAMPLKVRDRAMLRGLRPGMLVEVELVKQGGGQDVRRIRVREADNSIEADGRKVLLERPKEAVAVGQPVAGVPLKDHRGADVRLDQFAGKVVAVQFLYTRCPMPEVCPRLAATFAALQRRFAARMGADLVLLSVTLDPRYDSVEELSRYARIWRAGQGWRFLTGSEESIRFTAASFGMVYWPEEGVITHTSTIGLIGRDGRLSAVVEGLSFTARQLGDLIEIELRKQGNR
ncbi:MAG: SCO family protein [Acidobacteria bacterium]|nr:SCO family protein [Acidobacteriota bacterium]